MIDINNLSSSDELAAMAFGAVMMAIPLLPLGFKDRAGYGRGDPNEPRTTFRSWCAKARDELRSQLPTRVIGDYFRGWENLGTTLIGLIVSLYTCASIIVGFALIAGGALWLLL